MTDDRHHAHEWTRVQGAEGIRAWACTECDETSATCGTCNRASGSSLLLCGPCERHAARVLDDIADALSHYEPDPRSPIASAGNMHLVPGFSNRSGIVTESDIEGRMWSWVARWTEHTGASNASAADYLKARHMWAAHNPEVSDWPEYLRDMRRLRHQARRIAGLLPERLPEPCVHCGGQVVQDWADRWWKPLETGLSDVVRCLWCGMTWGDRARWLFSTRQHIVDVPDMHPDSLVTLAQARMIWRDVPAATWRSWARRDREVWETTVGAAQTWWRARCAHGTDEWAAWVDQGWDDEDVDEVPTVVTRALPERERRRGVALYRVGDLHALVQRWADDTRPGRRSAATERVG